MYATIQTGLGVTAAVVDGMDMREVTDLMRYWAKHPPTHVIARQVRDVVITALGGKPPSTEEPRTVSAEEFAAAVGLKLNAGGSGG
jgi:hypothetical protein